MRYGKFADRQGRNGYFISFPRKSGFLLFGIRPTSWVLFKRTTPFCKVRYYVCPFEVEITNYQYQ